MNLSSELNGLAGPMRPTQPADLILANLLHDVASDIERLPAEFQAEVTAHPDGAEMIARDFLFNLSQQASADVVFAVARAAGGPGTPEEVAQRLRAVLDSRAKKEAATS